MDEFKKGDKVLLKKLKQEGVILGKTSHGRYQVGVGSTTWELKPNEIEVLTATKYKQYSANLPRKKLEIEEKSEREFVPKLDLHGQRVEEAMQSLETAINQALMAGSPHLEVLHGLGTGRLIDAVHKHLKKHPVVESFRLDERNPGVTWVYF